MQQTVIIQQSLSDLEYSTKQLNKETSKLANTTITKNTSITQNTSTKKSKTMDSNYSSEEAYIESYNELRWLTGC